MFGAEDDVIMQAGEGVGHWRSDLLLGERYQASLRDARQFCIPPWTEVHDYRQVIATR
jgi:hypothetical protein